jgi:hypothetical protein
LIDIREFDFGYAPHRIVPDLRQHPDLVEAICARIDDNDERQAFRQTIMGQLSADEAWEPPLCFGEFVELLMLYGTSYKKVVSNTPLLVITRTGIRLEHV